MNKIEEKMPKERKLLASSIEPKQIMTEKGIPVIIHFKEKLKKRCDNRYLYNRIAILYNITKSDFSKTYV